MTDSLMLFIMRNCSEAPLWRARALFCVRDSTDSAFNLSQNFGLKVALATPLEKLSFSWSRLSPVLSPGGLDPSGIPALDKAAASPPPEGGSTRGGVGGPSGWSEFAGGPSVRSEFAGGPSVRSL